MLSFLAPGYIVAALAAAAGLFAAHFIVRRQPRAIAFPTARFVPHSPVLTTGWARTPADLLVLALRALCVLLTGLALAGPFVQKRGGGTARVILVDRSRAVADTTEVRDSVAALARPGDVVIGYAAAARVDSAGERGVTDAPIEGRGSLAAALVAATRAASALRDRADSVELAIVSTFAAEQLDSATARVRSQWPGSARLVPVAARGRVEATRAPTLVAGAGDVFAAALGAAGTSTYADARIVRGPLTGADSTWVAGASGRVVVHWPAAVAPVGFIAREAGPPSAALLTTSAAMVAPFPRPWRFVPALDRKPVAWWIDGDVAAMEMSHADGCIRSVAVPVTVAGDFVLRHDFHAALRDLTQLCGGARTYATLPAAALEMLRGPEAAARATAFAMPERDASPMTLWLILAALACALVELGVRAKRRTTVVADDLPVGSAPARKVA